MKAMQKAQDQMNSVLLVDTLGFAPRCQQAGLILPLAVGLAEGRFKKQWDHLKGDTLACLAF